MLVMGCDDKEQQGNRRSTSQVQVEGYVAQPKLLENRIVASGTILPNEQIELRSELSGRIEQLNFEEGSFVQKGTLLVKVDDAELRAQRSKFEAQLKIAAEDLERKKQLIAISGVSQEEYDVSQSRVDELTAELDLLKSRIRKATIYAPFSGHVGLRYASNGAFISTGDIISTLVQRDPVKIEFELPERYVGGIRNGLMVDFTVSGTDEAYQAEIYATDPMIDPSSRALKVRALSPNKEAKLVPGAFVELSVGLERIENALMVPTLAIVPLLNSQNVYVVKNNRAYLREVSTGIRKEKEVQITEGLQAGDTVATTGLLALKDSMSVQVAKVINP